MLFFFIPYNHYFNHENHKNEKVTFIRISLFYSYLCELCCSAAYPGSVYKQLSWRYSLWQKLDSAAISIDMVGYTPYFFNENAGNLITPPVSKYTGHVFDREHDAYYGITSSGLLNGEASTGWTGAALPSLAVRLNSYTPDIALMEIGTNDPNNTAGASGTVTAIEAMIDALRVKNPNVVVFVGKLPNSWYTIFNNTKINQIVTDKSTVQSPVIIVDVATGFINDTAKPGTMTWDWVHPNPLGQEFIAKRWFAAIQKQFNISTGLDSNAQSIASVEVYPSLTAGHISITNTNNAMIQIFNASGRMMKNIERTEMGTIQLDLSDLNNGLYIVNVIQGGKAVSKKIVLRK